MEYPGTKFTYPIRRATLIFFIAFFIIASPIIIMYTAGYRYDWANGLLKETGAISIDVEPPQASVYLNGIKLKDNMPIRLNNIAPGRYGLNISASGYYDWVTEIDVKNKQTVYIKEISLLKKNRPQILISGNMQTFALSDDYKYIIYTTQKTNNTEIWLWNTADHSAAILTKINTLNPLKISWSKNGDYAVVSNQTSPYTTLLLLNANNPLSITNISANTAQAIEKYQWDPQGLALYFSTKNNIISYDPQNQQTQIVTKNSYLDWYMYRGGLLTLQINTTSKQYKIISDTLGFKSAFNSMAYTGSDDLARNQYKIAMADAGKVLLKNTRTAEMELVTANNAFQISGDKFLVSKYNNWLIVWTPWELWTYSDGASEPNLLNRSGENLQQAIPLDQYNTLALVWANKTTALFPYYLVSHDLFNDKINIADADTDKKILYYIDNTKGNEGIWSLEY
ncbi:MAG: PEGA domain-containing protein [Patescibacteria group bacterium]